MDKTAADAVDLTGRTALVTGSRAESGWPRAPLARAGATVTVVARGEVAQQVADEVGGEAYRTTCPTRTCSPIWIWPPTSSPTTRVRPTGDAGARVPSRQFVAMQRLMVEAPFRLIRASLPRMYAQGYGRIVNISSAHGLRASQFKAGYVTGKHALEGLSKVVVLEGGQYGVTSNCVNPGYVRTPLVEKQIADQARAHGIPESEVLTTVLLADNPVKRMAEPDEIAELAVYLCSPEASYITGASLSIDGGWTAS
jgi:3-hydroxybutyrate dehydrogenase